VRTIAGLVLKAFCRGTSFAMAGIVLDPGQPIEGKRPDRFRPPHCPRRECSGHRPAGRYGCIRAGSYVRRCDPQRRVPRFLCLGCKRSFSRQSFATSYYLKRPELLAPVAAGLVAGSGHRQIARSLRCAPSTVTRLSARLGRHALLVQAEALAALEGSVDEPFVWDHFETFAFSQEDRLGIGTAVGQRSWFVFSFDPAPHRRGGRPASRRPAPRSPLPDAVPAAVVDSTRRALRLLARLSPGGFHLVSDDHPAYGAAVAGARGIRHSIHPNPPRGPRNDPRIARMRDRAMFAVDLLHKLLRHSQAHHRRETIAFGRRSNAILERTALMAVWRNFVKNVSERRSAELTPAMRLRLTARRWTWGDVLARRRFPERVCWPEGWRRIYQRGWITPAVGRNQRHELRHAF
jgi:transposase-like protein